MADRLDYFFRQRVTEAELDLGFELLEQADRNLVVDIGIFGVVAELIATERAGTPDLSVDFSGPGLAYDQTGQRISSDGPRNVDVTLDLNGFPTTVINSGNEKIVSVFVKFDRELSDPRTDGNNLQVFFRRSESVRFVVRQGGEALAGTAVPPALQPDEVLLVDVTRTFGQTQILDSDLSPNPLVPGDVGRRQNFVLVDASAIGVSTVSFDTLLPTNPNVQASFDEVDDELTDHFTGAARRHPATAIDFAGGPSWVDGSTNPARTMEAQIDDMLSQLGGTNGASRLGAPQAFGSPTDLVAPSIAGQLQEILDHHNTHLNDTSAAHDASALPYFGAAGAASFVGPVYSAPGNQLDGALDFLLQEVNKRVAKAGDSISGTLDLGSGRIGAGLDVGFQTSTPLADQVRVGNTSFFMHWNGVDPLINFDASNDRLLYDRSVNAYLFQVGGSTEMRINGLGANITNGLYVGNSSTSPTNNGIVCEGGLTVGTTTVPVNDAIIIGVSDFRLVWNGVDPYIQFDDAGGLDRILFDRSVNEYQFQVNGVTEARINASGLEVTNGLLVGFNATPTNDAVLVADANFGLIGGSVPEIRFDSSDRIRYDRADDRMIFSAGAADVLAIKQRSLTGTSFFNQRRNSSVAFLEDTTSGCFMSNSLSITGSNINGTLSVSGNSTNNSPNVRVNYNGFFTGGKGLVIDSAGFVSARRAHMNLEPFSVSGVGTLPDIGVTAGDIFAAADFSPDRLYFHNGNGWVQAA